VTTEAQFNYAWCLVRSKYPADIRKGILLLEDLFKDNLAGEAKRDYLYYLAIGNARIKVCWPNFYSLFYKSKDIDLNYFRKLN
jgi:hypothetical protein